MVSNRKTSASVAKLASKILLSPTSGKPARKVSGSALSQRAPKKHAKK